MTTLAINIVCGVKEPVGAMTWWEAWSRLKLLDSNERLRACYERNKANLPARWQGWLAAEMEIIRTVGRRLHHLASDEMRLLADSL